MNWKVYRPARRVFPGLVLLGLVLAAPAAWGHGVELFAAVEGTEIRGTLRYADGTRITGAPVRAYDADGALLAETTTDEGGRFTLTPACRCDHRIVGDAGEGHLGSYTVKAGELPASLPADPADEPGDARAPQAGEDSAAPAGEIPADEALEARLEKVVARQLNPLREQLFAYEKTIRFRDIVGGIGYVFGLAGVIVLVKHRKSRPDS